MLEGFFRVIATAENGVRAMELVRELSSDVALLDISMPEMNGIETALQLKKEGLPVRVVFLTAHEDSDFMAAALATGAVGYVLKRRLTSDLILSLRTVLRGDIFVSRPCPF
jgi:two-component system response regulator DegU